MIAGKDERICRFVGVEGLGNYQNGSWTGAKKQLVKGEIDVYALASNIATGGSHHEYEVFRFSSAVSAKK